MQDARRHGIRVLPVDVRYSDWDCTLAFGGGDTTTAPSIRMGLRMISGFVEDVATRLAQARATRMFADVEDVCRRADLDRRHQDLLADAGALKGLAGHRHRARWEIRGVEPQLPLFAIAPPTAEVAVVLPPPTVAEDVLADYASVGTTLGPHPLRLLRSALVARRCRRSSELAKEPHGKHVRFAGLV